MQQSGGLAKGFIMVVQYSVEPCWVFACTVDVHTRKYNKTQFIPLVADNQKLTSFLEEKSRSLVLQLNSGPDAGTWQELCEVVLTPLVLFNRRRASDTERL
jgi:hypothetical protein